MKITEALIVEHRIFLTVFDQIDRVLADAKTLSEVVILASLVKSMLEDHDGTETNLAYLACDHALQDKDQLDRMSQEHQEIDARLRKVGSARTGMQARRLLAAAIDFSREHMQFEELSVFPSLESVLQPETLDELGSRWQLRREAASATG